MKGKLLIAQPLLNDGFFNRSVVFISSHSLEGVVGFILNFKSAFKLRDLRPQIKNGSYPIYDGGPVSRNQLFFLHRLGDRISESVHVIDDLFFGGDFNEMLHIIEHENIREDQVRFFAGYSGWDIDQLKNEISNQSWYVNSISSQRILNSNYENIWGEQLSLVKKELKIFSDIGNDPSLN